MEPCEGCKDPEFCLGSYPEDDPHRSGQRGCFAEKARGVHLADGPAGRELKHGIATKSSQNLWEKGRAGEERPNGTFMPYISPKTGAPMTQKEFGSGGRRAVEEGRRRIAAKPTT